MNKFFARHSFKIILLMVFLLPIMSRGARKTLTSNDNDVHDWLPPEYPETTSFNWFQEHFENETFVLISWDGCTLEDDRLELLARKLAPIEDVPAGDGGKRLFKRVETGPRLVKRLTSPPLNLPEEEVLKRLEGLFYNSEYKQSCAVITLTEEGKRDLRKTLNDFYARAKTELGLPRERIRMGGPPVDNVAISVEGEKTLIRLFIPAGIVGLSLAWWCLRSVRLTTMVFSVAVFSAAVSLAVVFYSGGTMNAILLTMPAVVYVAGISGAIHFANYYRDSVVECGVDGAPGRAVSNAWLPCVLSAGTTAAGLFSLWTSELVPIQLFGVYSAIGVLATLALLFLFLPAWMQVWPMKPHSLLDGEAPKQEDVGLPVRWRRFLEGVLDHHRWVLAGLLGLMIVCGIGLFKIDTSIKLTKLFSPDAEIIHNYEWLEERLGPLVPMEIIVRLDNSKSRLTFLERLELLDRVQDRLKKINGIGNTMSAVTFAPSLKVERKGPMSKSVMRGIVNKKMEDHRQEYADSGFFNAEGNEELWRISARVGALNDIDYGEFVNDIKAAVEPVLAAERERIAARDQRERNRARAAAGAASAVMLVSHEAASAVDGTDVPGALGQNDGLADGQNSQGIRATYTGLVPLVYKAQRSMLNGLAWNFATDLFTIAAVMTVVFLEFSAGLILLLPSIFPLVVVFGIMGWLGIKIDVGTVMTPTVALGVSVDDVMHFLIWYRRALSQGKTRKQAAMFAYEDCARAMYQSWAVLGLGLAVFALSSFVPTQRFGALMFTLLTAALVGNLILLPSVLCSPLSFFFCRRVMRKAKNQPPQPHQVPAGHIFTDKGTVPGHIAAPHLHHDSSHSPTRS